MSFSQCNHLEPLAATLLLKKTEQCSSGFTSASSRHLIKRATQPYGLGCFPLTKYHTSKTFHQTGKGTSRPKTILIIQQQSVVTLGTPCYPSSYCLNNVTRPDYGFQKVGTLPPIHGWIPVPSWHRVTFRKHGWMDEWFGIGLYCVLQSSAGRISHSQY
jgi:hypothetical protein